VFGIKKNERKEALGCRQLVLSLITIVMTAGTKYAQLTQSQASDIYPIKRKEGLCEQ
jgi:hypothetical protein